MLRRSGNSASSARAPPFASTPWAALTPQVWPHGAGLAPTSRDLIDGAEVLPLLAAFGITPLFPGDATQSVSGVAGLPGPTIPGPGALLTFGITNRFNLSSLDQATWNSTFIIEAVPEPGTALLLGFGLLAVGVVRRRAARH